MAKYFMAKIDTITFRLRVEIGDETALFLFLYFENSYKILNYTFLPTKALANQSMVITGAWQKVKADKAQPILELGMQEWTALVQAVKHDS